MTESRGFASTFGQFLCVFKYYDATFGKLIFLRPLIKCGLRKILFFDYCDSNFESPLSVNCLFDPCYQDFPEPIKVYNTYRMRAFGYWLGKNGIAVINNVRWGTSETYRYCFDGIEQNSIVAIGTVGGSPRKYEDRVRFESGLKQLPLIQ